GGLLPPAAWFQHVSRIRAPVRLVAMRYCPDDAKEAWNRHREATQRAGRRLARDIALNLGSGGAVTVIHPGRILWIDTAPSCRPDIIRLAITSAAGLLELVGQTEVQPNGSAALRQARSRVFFGADLSHGLPAESRSIPQRAHAAFLELFPNGL